MKRYLNEALLYAVLSLVGGVFYREFTKIHGFVKKTTLEVVHTHYFILGMIVLLPVSYTHLTLPTILRV